MARPKKAKQGLTASLTIRLSPEEKDFIEDARGSESASDFTRGLLRPYVISWRRGEFEVAATTFARIYGAEATNRIRFDEFADGKGVGFMRSIERQDPFHHFSQWPNTNLEDPRHRLRADLTEFIRGVGDSDADRIRQRYSIALGSYKRKAATAVASDTSKEASMRRILILRLDSSCHYLLNALNLLDDLNWAITGRAAMAMVEELTPGA